MKSGKKDMDRRTFLKTTVVGSTSLALTRGFGGNGLAAEPAEDNSSKKMPTRILGKTGVPVSILSLGGGVDWTINQTLLRVAYNQGINSWDTAYIYENGKSEIGIGQYFEKYPEDRKKIFLSTKARATEPKGMTEQLNTSFERLKTDYIDSFNMHMVGRPEILTPEIKAWVEQGKKEGKFRFFGFSCHSNMAKMLMYASNLGWIDTITTSYNFNIMNDDDIKKGIDACYRAGIGLIAMKSQALFYDNPYYPLGPAKDEDFKVAESFMAKGYTPHQARLKAVWTDERIATCLSEMKNLTMLKDNVVAATDSIKLTGSDMDMLNRLAHANRSFYCQSCMRCESAMGSESRIADVLRYMMYFNSYGKTDDARRLFSEMPEAVRNSLAARDYSHAEQVCPNKIQIGKAMKEAVRVLA
jgi:predicted aldo/keto reductase-like oxidoreductase